MPRIVKLVAAGIGTGAAVAAAFFLHPTSGPRRRAAVRRESANVAALVGVAVDVPRRSLRRDQDLLAASVRDALEAMYGAEAALVAVKEERGVVTLRGEVEDIEDIARYEAAARDIPGVRDVDNLLRLRITATRPRVLTA
ncbi:MAG: BON domain-containing protein [Candidatus Dormibacteraeota bacterium]|nr:BON domain-containing protein [Candidatus Dormibacteraeota bacterium]